MAAVVRNAGNGESKKRAAADHAVRSKATMNKSASAMRRSQSKRGILSAGQKKLKRFVPLKQSAREKRRYLRVSGAPGRFELTGGALDSLRPALSGKEFHAH